MKPISIQDDIIPIGEFKTHASRVMRQLRDTGRPVVITLHGRPAGVLVSAAEFDRLTERDRFIAAVNQGLAESEAGLAIDDEDLNACSTASSDHSTRREAPLATPCPP